MSEDVPDSIASCKSVARNVERSSSEPLLSTLMPRGEWGTLEPMMKIGFVPKVGLGVEGTAMAKMSCMCGRLSGLRIEITVACISSSSGITWSAIAVAVAAVTVPPLVWRLWLLWNMSVLLPATRKIT